MDKDFWLRKWEIKEIAFHEREVNALLANHVDALSLVPGSRVFVPLCGKTRDISWLLAHGHRVAGAELIGLAVDELFAELGVTPSITQLDQLVLYQAPGIDIFVGDIFAVSRARLGQVDAVYDRAALVALPAQLRARYAAHLVEITARAPQLLICYEYDQNLLAGPPYSIAPEEVRQHYGATYQVTQLARVAVKGGFKGRYPASEAVWLLR